MPRPRTQPTPSWSSSSRMFKKSKKDTANTETKNTNVQVVLYDRPRYIAGVSTVPSRPISLVPENDTKDAYIVDKVVTPFDGWGPQAATAEEYDTDEEDARYAADPARRQVQRVLNYVVGWRSGKSDEKPNVFELVPCTRILEYVSPYVLEAYEYALCERRRSHVQAKKEAPKTESRESRESRETKETREKAPKKRGRPGRKRTAKTDKATAKDDDRTKRALAQQRDGNGKFERRPASAASTAQPVVSLSSIPSLSPSKTRTAEPLSLKRPYDSFAEQTETDDIKAEVEVGDSDDSDDELANVLRMAPAPLPAYASASSASSSSSRSTPAAPTSTTKKVTRVEPPRVMGMRGEAPLKRVKVEKAVTGKKEKKEKREKREKKVTPVPVPVLGSSQPRQSKPKEEPPEDDDEEIYEVDRLEGDCYTYIDDETAVPKNGSPPPKKLVQYFSVRWKGNWPPDQNPTWEPAENLPPRMVQQYLRRLARREQAMKQAQRGAASKYDDDLLLDSSDNDDGASQGGLAPIVSSDII